MELKRYKKSFNHSYAFGVYATLELARLRPTQVAQVLLSEKSKHNAGVTQIAELCAQLDILCEVNDRLVNRVSPKESHLAVGVFKKYAVTLNPAANHVVLVNPGDMGNLGAIIRTMLGFGARDLILIRPAVDIFDPKVVRASMGALFRLNFAYFDDFGDYHRAFDHELYPFMTDGATALQETVFREPFALIFGNESSGLPPNFARIGASVTIRHSAAIDSLNLAVAVGIALHSATRP